MPAFIFLLMLICFAMCMFIVMNSLFAGVGGWTKSYQKLAKRYGTRVGFSGFRPKLSFMYGKTQCILKNVGRSTSRCTRLQILWPDGRLKLLITKNDQPGYFKRLKRIAVQSEGDFTVFSNKPSTAERMVNPTTDWKMRQLMELCGGGLEIRIERGKMLVLKSGFIKNAVQLDDFVRHSLDLFDQFKLAVNNDLEFVSESDAVVVSDIVCPICSGQITEQLVSCIRCKTPHCADCWEYNGQCATFACSETRYFDASTGNTVS